ncbi:MAG: NUDIX domain-containing protein [Candidatus Uhrbacteria bacterium]
MSSRPSFAIKLSQLSIAVDIVVCAIREGALSVILIRRAIPPFRGKWAIPGGFVLPEESLDKAALRELHEETGVRASRSYIEQLYAFGEPRRDPRRRIISVTYLMLVDGEKIEPRGGSDAAEARWWSFDHLPSLAFDHGAILAYALRRLRYKLEYTNVMYAMLPETFTLAELQRAYEVVLSKPLDKRNFRKKIIALNFVEPTKERRQPEQGRPARLWRFVQRKPVFVKTFVAKA